MYTGIYLSSKGCFTFIFVSIPIFSAFSKASVVDEFFLQDSMNSFISLLDSLNFLLISWSGDNPIKDAPKIVSGLVVKTLISSFSSL